MKVNYGAMLRLALLSLLINMGLQAAGASTAVTLTISFFLGLTYPEKLFTQNTEDKKEK